MLADGYTLLLTTNSPLTSNLALYSSLDYEAADFEPVVMVVNPKLGQYYQSASSAVGGPALLVIDVKARKLAQKIPTSNGAHSIGIALAQNHIYLPTTAKDGPCGGCILVFAPQ